MEKNNDVLDVIINDAADFESADIAFQESYQKSRDKVRAEIEEEQKTGNGFKFSQHDTNALIEKYPYSASEKEKVKAQQADIEQAKKDALEAEIDKRTGEDKATLENLYFGKEGRNFYQNKFDLDKNAQQTQQAPPEQSKDEVQDTKVSAKDAFKEKMRQQGQEQEPDGQEQSDSADTPQKNIRDDYNMRAFEHELNEHHSEESKVRAEDAKQVTDIDAEKVAFKERMRESFNQDGQEMEGDGMEM